MNTSSAKIWARVKNIIILILIMNSIVIFNTIKLRNIFCALLITVFILFYLYINIIPIHSKKLNKRLRIMICGYELTVDFIFSLVIESILYMLLLIFYMNDISTKVIVINAIIAVCILIITLINGFFRIMITSRDLGIVNRILVLMLWWVPILNIIILVNCLKKVRYEYFLEETKELRNDLRVESELCNTKYPIVLVHGIFFRDWMFINYWGRIPKELIKNGAEIFYGHQQSSNSVCKSAEELKNNILKIIDETRCEKVNIIAHSKGGLDSRYAISVLGLSEYVASLTTINTPHRGCKYVDFLLDKIPDSFKKFVSNKYNNVFTKLGDKNPDFIGGITDLTAKKCEEFNKKVFNAEGVLYQSVTSKMKNIFSAGFPLNIGYIFAKLFDGENDGLVSVSSAKWGDFLGLISLKGNRGISHGDIIDLTRQDIKGYDVCEFYVDIVKNLKEKGL